METMDAIRLRCSLKTRLSDRPVPADVVERVLRAAHLAPSARNTQPRRFLVLRERAAIDELAAAALSEASAVIARAPEPADPPAARRGRVRRHLGRAVAGGRLRLSDGEPRTRAAGARVCRLREGRQSASDHAMARNVPVARLTAPRIASTVWFR